MKAVVYRGLGKVALESVPDPIPKQPTDAIIRIKLQVLFAAQTRILSHEARRFLLVQGYSGVNLW